jgi:hypothetical protein
VNGEDRDVAPKDQSAKIQLDPIAAATTASEQCEIQEVDWKRQQPENQTNDQMFAPDELHQPFGLPNFQSE